jgi:hypothetical protein
MLKHPTRDEKIINAEDQVFFPFALWQEFRIERHIYAREGGKRLAVEMA